MEAAEFDRLPRLLSAAMKNRKSDMKKRVSEQKKSFMFFRFVSFVSFTCDDFGGGFCVFIYLYLVFSFFKLKIAILGKVCLQVQVEFG